MLSHQLSHLHCCSRQLSHRVATGNISQPHGAAAGPQSHGRQIVLSRTGHVLRGLSAHSTSLAPRLEFDREGQIVQGVRVSRSGQSRDQLVAECTERS